MYIFDIYGIFHYKDEIDGLVQERRNSIADALELRLSCTNPSKRLWWQSDLHNGEYTYKLVQ